MPPPAPDTPPAPPSGSDASPAIEEVEPPKAADPEPVVAPVAAKVETQADLVRETVVATPDTAQPSGKSLDALIQANAERSIEDSAEERAWLENSAQKLRSEEHTSELQSLIRISYDFFGLKKQRRST